MKNKEVQESLRQVGIRLIEEPPLLSPEPMSSPEAAVRVLGEWLSEMDRELFCVVNLNSNLTPINMNVVSMGALNVAYVHPRDAMKSAILSNAAYMMLIHNHPSGSMTPSKEDIKITDQIQSAASLMGIPVLDHIIVGRHQEFFSIRENNVFSYQNDIDGGIYDNPDSPIKQVVEDILEDAGISLDDAEWMDYEELDAKVEYAEEIKQLAVDLDKFSYEYDTYEYKDSIEDREEQIDKLTEDILTRKTGDIKKWLIEVSENSEIDNDVITARSLYSRLEEVERVFISDETNVSFYAAECMEFPDFGELHENLTLDEAIKKYESIPEERMHGVKGIGFELEDGSDYEGKYGLMYHGRVDRENVEMIQYYKDNPVIQKALDALEQYCETSADKSVERQQETNRKKKQKSIYQGLHR